MNKKKLNVNEPTTEKPNQTTTNGCEPQTTPHKQKQNTVNQLTALPLLSCYNSDFGRSFLNFWVHTEAGIWDFVVNCKKQKEILILVNLVPAKLSLFKESKILWHIFKR